MILPWQFPSVLTVPDWGGHREKRGEMRDGEEGEKESLSRLGYAGSGQTERMPVPASSNLRKFKQANEWECLQESLPLWQWHSNPLGTSFFLSCLPLPYVSPSSPHNVINPRTFSVSFVPAAPWQCFQSISIKSMVCCCWTKYLVTKSQNSSGCKWLLETR